MNVATQSVNSFLAGHGTVGTSEAKLSAVNFKVQKHIVIRAAASNSGSVIVGGPGNAAAGFVLAAGTETPPLYVDDTDDLRVIGSESNQAFSWLGN